MILKPQNTSKVLAWLKTVISQPWGNIWKNHGVPKRVSCQKGIWKVVQEWLGVNCMAQSTSKLCNKISFRRIKQEPWSKIYKRLKNFGYYDLHSEPCVPNVKQTISILKKHKSSQINWRTQYQKLKKKIKPCWQQNLYLREMHFLLTKILIETTFEKIMFLITTFYKLKNIEQK